MRDRVLPLLGQAEWERCAEDPLYWLDPTQHDGIVYVYTKDPHNIYTCRECGVEVVEDRRVIHNETMHPTRAITLQALMEGFDKLPAIRPFTVMEYMPPMIHTWLTHQYNAVEKSRDMMATWLYIALHTWDAMFHRGRQVIFQSEDAFKTLELVQRSELIYRQTPPFLRKAIGAAAYSKGNAKSGELFFPDIESEILGFPQGANQIRQFHPGAVYVDEAAFHTEAAAGFAAIKPAIMMGGKFTMVSTANRSWFEEVCRDRIGEAA